MGEVYRALDTRLDRVVAIKVLKDKFSERFEREARAISALNHWNGTGFQKCDFGNGRVVDCGLWNVATRSTRNTRNGGGIESGFVVRHLRLQSFEEAFTATYGAGAVSAASMKEMMVFAEKACL